MSKEKEGRKKIKAKINAIKKMGGDLKNYTEKNYDNFLDNVSDLDSGIPSKVDSFLSSSKSKINNKTNFFGDILDLGNSFINNVQPVTDSDTLYGTNRLKKHANNAVKLTLKETKSIILNNVQKAFFAGDGICGSEAPIPNDNMTIKPQDFDFLNVLTIDPSSSMGKIVYESDKPSNKVKFNQHLYNTFSDPYDFTSVNEKTLFSLDWNESNQEYNVTGLKQNISEIKVADFLNDYYSSIEMINFEHVVKTAVSLTTQGDGTETKLFNMSLNNVERLLDRLFSLCPGGGNGLFESNPSSLYDETEDSFENYFDFDRVDDVNMENEDARLRRVLKFKDCDNFEIPVDASLIGDFSYLAQTTNNIEELVDSTLERAAATACELSGGRFNLPDLSLSIKNLYILNLPKALICTILSPKIFFPIILLYKQLRASIIEAADTVKEFIKALGKMFKSIILEIFWKFIREFWNFIKPDLIKFLMNLAQRIIKEKYRKYVLIVTSLLAFLTQLIKSSSCESLYTAIDTAINSTLSGGISTSIPNLLLAMSKLRSGFSQERASVEVIEYMESMGIDTGDIYGEPNEIIGMVKSIISGTESENTKNGLYQGVNDGFYLGTFYFPPGIIKTNSIKS